MLRLFIAFTFILFSASILNAQDFVIEDDGLSDTLKPVLALIPFQNNYYRSEIDRSLAAKENLDYQSLKNTLRKELDRQLFMILKDDFEVISLLKDNSQEDQEILDYIFYSTASSFTNLESGEEVDRQLLSKGQIKTAPEQEGQRYMKTVIHHPPLMKTLEEQLPSDYYLFIGELDILKPQNIEEKEDNRYVFVHFTYYNNKGEVLDSGIISQVIPARKCRSIKNISLDGFAPVAYQFKNRLTPEQ